jgi:hypothetical protein
VEVDADPSGERHARVELITTAGLEVGLPLADESGDLFREEAPNRLRWQTPQVTEMRF